MPVLELEVDVPLLLVGHRPDHLLGALGLLPRAGVTEHLRPVGGDDHAVVKRGVKVVLELGSLEVRGEKVRELVLVQVDLQPPVVVHVRDSSGSRATDRPETAVHAT